MNFNVFKLVVPIMLALLLSVQTVSADQAVDAEPQKTEAKINQKVEIKFGDDVEEVDDVKIAEERIAKLKSKLEKFDFIDRADIKELDDLSDEEKKELSEALGELSKINIGYSGIGIFEAIVAIVAICLTLGLPVIILIVALVSAQRKRRQMMTLINSYIEADRPVPEHVLSEFSGSPTGKKQLKSGINIFVIGVGIALFFGIISDDWSVSALGFIPMAIGAARLFNWYIDNQGEEPAKDKDGDLSI